MAIAWISLPLAAQPLLDRAVRAVEQFAEDLPATTCIEMVTQLRLGEGTKIVDRRQTQFDYLILVDNAPGDFAVNESRILRGKPARNTPAPMLATSGFATMLLVFHPQFRASFDYKPAAEEPRIDFEYKPGSPSPTLLEVRGREYPIPWRGSAWLDPESGMIVRIQTELQQPLDDIGLQALRAEASYERVTLTSAAQSYWLPKAAIVELHTKRQHWRNIHTFSGFRRFEVSAETKEAKPVTQ